MTEIWWGGEGGWMRELSANEVINVKSVCVCVCEN